MGSQNWWFGDPRTLLYRVKPLHRRVQWFLGCFLFRSFFHKFHGTKKGLIILEPMTIHDPQTRRDPLCFVGPFSLCCRWFGHEDPDLAFVFQLYASLRAASRRKLYIYIYQQDIRQAHRLMVSYHITTRTFGNLITSKARQQLSVVLGRHGKHRDHGRRQPNTWRFWVLPLGDAFLWCSMAQRSIFCWLHWTEAEEEHCLSLTYDFMFSLFDSWISFGSAWIDHSCLMITSPGVLTKFQYSIWKILPRKLMDPKIKKNSKLRLRGYFQPWILGFWPASSWPLLSPEDPYFMQAVGSLNHPGTMTENDGEYGGVLARMVFVPWRSRSTIKWRHAFNTVESG